MKRYIVGLLALVSLSVSAQYVKVSNHYDAKTTAKEIIKGRLNNYLNDQIDFTFEKRVGVFKSKLEATPEYVESKVYKAFDKGDIEFISKTNGGYTFTIIVTNRRDDTKIIHYCTFSVDAFTQKITSVEIYKGE